MKALTIFTPTYNRGYCLENCYNSLLKQTNQNFIWLIIDDGSTDNTKELISRWMRESRLEIHYIWQENQGMHGAHNTAYEAIDTELNVCIDSDDFMPEQAVEKILAFWEQHGSKNISGIIGLDAFKDHTIIGTELPADVRTSTLFDLYYKHKVTGDKKLVYRTELTKKYPYPIFKGEKYVGLAYKYYMLDKDFDMLLMNEVLCYVEYLEDGSSRNMLNQYRKNPKGFAFYRCELMKLPFTDFLFIFRQAVHYVSSSILSRNKKFISESPRKAVTVLAIPCGFLLYVYIQQLSRLLS
ncbi:glycosyltransferase family 2 protein [Heyndrickxia acidicola]|uniref:Glycosyltransferase family A protein n=1 Tax=Heyndrickxia acidicola TaxID=209389 RepID=A0ABU6ML31_9BACI|nr:glycosyltransferase family A protein [Heyndrickxia acidicola]MED1205194.1 glycosyltransferase family A protein [Heyndrickxia acidicola]